MPHRTNPRGATGPGSMMPRDEAIAGEALGAEAPGPRSPMLTALRRLLPVALVLALLAAAYALGLHDHFSLEALAARRDWLERLVAENEIKAALGFLAIYIAAVSVSIPGATVLTIAGGFMFGWLPGTALSLTGATIGATIIFLIARTALGGLLEAKAGPRLQKLQAGFREDAFHYLLFLRLAPLFPFWLINVAPALFGMRLGAYVLATIIGILPGTLAYSYFGRGLGTALEPGGPVLSTDLLIGFGALGLVALMPVVIRRWRRARKPAI